LLADCTDPDFGGEKNWRPTLGGRDRESLIKGKGGGGTHQNSSSLWTGEKSRGAVAPTTTDNLPFVKEEKI